MAEVKGVRWYRKGDLLSWSVGFEEKAAVLGSEGIPGRKGIGTGGNKCGKAWGWDPAPVVPGAIHSLRMRCKP